MNWFDLYRGAQNPLAHYIAQKPQNTNISRGSAVVGRQITTISRASAVVGRQISISYWFEWKNSQNRAKMSQNRSKSSKMAKKGPGGSKFHNFRKKIEKMESNTALKNAIFSFSRGTPGEIFKIGPKIDFGGHFLLENHYFLPILAKSTKNRPQRGQKGGPMAPLQRVV